MSLSLPLHGQVVTVFGGTGFVGRYVVSRLAAAGASVRVVTRHPQRAYFLKTHGSVGQIVGIRGEYGSAAQMERLVSGSDIVVNCLGILFEKGKNTFARLHTEYPAWIGQACAAAKVRTLIHISALGINQSASRYAKSKLSGEEALHKAFPSATILRPSVIFGPEDNFFNQFARLSRLLPFLPLFGGGKTKFQPVYVGDVAEAVFEATVQEEARGRIYELAGPEILTFRQVYEQIFSITKTPKFLLPIPWGLARAQAAIFSLFPKPLLTSDQLISLQTDNVVTKGSLTLSDLGLVPTALHSILPGYLSRYIPGGESALKKDSSNMKKYLALFLIGVGLCWTNSPALAAGKEGIAAVVNQDVVTKSDLMARHDLIAASTGLPRTPELMAKLRPQIVDMLIEEEIKMQEANRLKIEVTKEEIAQGFKSIADQNKVSPQDFRKMLESSGIRVGTMEDQIRAQIAWTKVVQRKIRPQIEVSDADVDSELEQLRANIGKPQYKISEIFLPLMEGKKPAEIQSFAEKLVSQLQKKPEAFGKVAQQFSAAPGAAQGGAVGWVIGGQMPTEVDAVLPSLSPRSISNPIKTQSGFYIIFLQEKREITEALLPSREDIMQRVGGMRLDRAQRRYLMDLRSSAFVEKRD
ncbi:MAG: peptidylprolyl isomerase [Alphaproteobacteria bacterium]|nr:peptidylprolyl isomerase [Alphaproteobacteria bacterium]